MTMPWNQVTINDLLLEFALFAILRANADAPPVWISSYIRLPMRPQTMMTQPIVSSCMTCSVISERLAMTFPGEISRVPTTTTASSAATGRCVITAVAITTSVGSKLMMP